MTANLTLRRMQVLPLQLAVWLRMLLWLPLMLLLARLVLPLLLLVSASGLNS